MFLILLCFYMKVHLMNNLSNNIVNYDIMYMRQIMNDVPARQKYKQKKVRILGLFLDLGKVDCIILATNLLHLILSIYSL